MKLLLAVLLGAGLGTVAWAAPLDGTKWKVTVTPDKEAAENGEKPFEDELVFDDGKVTATAAGAHGFKASVYLVTENDDVMKWQTVQHSVGEGVANWTGRITETEVTGKLIWTRRDGLRLVYTFAGTRTKAAEAPKKE